LDDIGLKPLEALSARRSLGQHVFQSLKTAIICGNLAPHTRLVETRIAQLLDISRTPVREALHKLEREGLLVRKPRGGFAVVGLTAKDIEETFGVRSVLEGYAARLAAQKHVAGELDPLKAKIAEYETCLVGGCLESLPKINTEFHDMLYALSKSSKLIRIINSLRDQIYRFRMIILKNPAMAKTSNEDHRQMLQRIELRDARGADRLVQEHILRGKAAVLAMYKQRGTLDAPNGE
jgi:DNA-binding GntR family transcriptional regulator